LEKALTDLGKRKRNVDVVANARVIVPVEPESQILIINTNT